MQQQARGQRHTAQAKGPTTAIIRIKSRTSVVGSELKTPLLPPTPPPLPPNPRPSTWDASAQRRSKPIQALAIAASPQRFLVFRAFFWTDDHSLELYVAKIRTCRDWLSSTRETPTALLGWASSALCTEQPVSCTGASFRCLQSAVSGSFPASRHSFASTYYGSLATPQTKLSF